MLDKSAEFQVSAVDDGMLSVPPMTPALRDAFRRLEETLTRFLREETLPRTDTA
jgi:hypothetical protein